ncbi:MAG: hypothetical protein KDK71_01330 [Chlamydiia bacterium]|nr:hypothetical protein [Chlamydiia bacterium]
MNALNTASYFFRGTSGQYVPNWEQKIDSIIDVQLEENCPDLQGKYVYINDPRIDHTEKKVDGMVSLVVKDENRLSNIQSFWRWQVGIYLGLLCAGPLLICYAERSYASKIAKAHPIPFGLVSLMPTMGRLHLMVALKDAIRTIRCLKDVITVTIFFALWRLCFAACELLTWDQDYILGRIAEKRTTAQKEGLPKKDPSTFLKNDRIFHATELEALKKMRTTK